MEEDMKNRPELLKCPTGIQGLDDVTHGGLPRARPTLVCGGPGCGKTTMSMEFLARGALEHDEPGVFVSFEEESEALLKNYAAMSWQLPELVEEDSVRLLQMRVNKSEVEEAGGFDLQGLFLRLEHAIEDVGARRVVLDTVEVLFGAFESSHVIRAELQRLCRWLKDREVTALITGESGERTLTRHGLEEYVSDCVIQLRHDLREQISTRRLRVVKYRGSEHGQDAYPFLIGSDGITVFPMSSLSLDHMVSSERVSTGVEGLDEMLGGGFYGGSTILVSGTAGTGKSSLAATFVDAACRRGNRCIYYAFEESTDQIVRNMRSIGINLDQWLEAGTLRICAERPYRYGLEEHLLRMQRAVRSWDPDAVIVDPLSNLREMGGFQETKHTLTQLVDFLKSRQTTALMTDLSQDGEALERTNSRISSLMDSWLLLRDAERDGERNHLLYILKSRGMAHSRQVREFRMTSDGLKLVDVYVGSDGVLTGTARYTQEMQDELEKDMRQKRLERAKAELEKKQSAMEARIEQMRAEYEAEKKQLQNEIEDLTMKQELEQKARRKRHQLRDGGHT